MRNYINNCILLKKLYIINKLTILLASTNANHFKSLLCACIGQFLQFSAVACKDKIQLYI